MKNILTSLTNNNILCIVYCSLPDNTQVLKGHSEITVCLQLENNMLKIYVSIIVVIFH